MYSGDRPTIAQYEADEKRRYKFLRESSLPPEFPFIVENGEMEFDITTTQKQFQAVGDELDETGRQFALVTLVHTEKQDPLLIGKRIVEQLTTLCVTCHFHSQEVREALDWPSDVTPIYAGNASALMEQGVQEVEGPASGLIAEIIDVEMGSAIPGYAKTVRTQNPRFDTSTASSDFSPTSNPTIRHVGSEPSL